MKTNLGGKLCLTLLAALSASMAIAASSPPTRHFQAASIRGPIQSTVHPLAVDRTPVIVVAILAGDSVANAQEKAGRRLSREEKGAIKAQRVREQSASWGSIESAGGRVIGTFQSALNGLKVSIPRNQVSLLRQAAGVVDVLPVRTYHLNNIVSVPRIQAPIAWSGADGVRGEGIKVGIIDTGIDYTHANFGGPGTVAAYQAALAGDTLPADPTLFGPNAPKVKGGIDLVGDAYDAGGTGDALVPHPDSNPLDCNSHGSHVAGTAAGLGVLATGGTYQGPYDQLTDINNDFTIGPGVAPRADLYAIRVFGCSGSTNVVVDALEWAVDNDMDVVNMSLGSDFGPGDTADAKATDDTVKAGVVVVSAAGNAGDILYSLGSPGSSLKGIAVAASAREAFDRTATFALSALPGAGLPAKNITALNANNGSWSSPENLTVVVLRNPDGTVSLGCDPAEYVNAQVQGKIAVVQRGVCARVARAIFGQQAGAAAVVMINNAASLPPFEGAITSDPDNGLQFKVTIPFFGVKGLATTTSSDGFALVQRDGTAITLTEGAAIPTGMASFSSTGPRSPDSRLKPDITAPGLNIVSTGMGTGNQGQIDSGTSMATPHITGTAALAIQAHPKWKPNAIKSAIINSGSPANLSDYTTRRAGSGFVNAAGVVGTQAIAFADTDETTMNFQFNELSSDFSKTKSITVKNDGVTPVSFDVTIERKQGSPHTVTLGTSHITVGPRSNGSVDVTLQVPVATAGDSSAFRDVAGLVTFTPTTANSNHGYALRVPYYLVPRVTANVDAKLSLKNKATQGVVALTNQGSAIKASADFYAWGLLGQNNRLGQIDLHAAGVQSFPDGQGDATVVFAINTFKGGSTQELQEFDVLIDVDGDGVADFDVFSIDIGRLIGPSFLPTGEMVAAFVNLKTNALGVDFDAVAPTNSGTILLPVQASDIGVTPTNPRFSYTVESFDEFSSNTDSFPTSAKFNAFSSAVSTGDFAVVSPNAAVGVTVSVDPAEFAVTPALGFMIVSQDNKNGAPEVNLLSVKH
jgi:minor extracellular serine protease Vpr